MQEVLDAMVMVGMKGAISEGHYLVEFFSAALKFKVDPDEKITIA